MFLEESLDVDPNYDPSDFLMSGLPIHKQENITHSDIKLEEHQLTDLKIHDDLAVSESEDEGGNPSTSINPQQVQDDDDVADGDLWF